MRKIGLRLAYDEEELYGHLTPGRSIEVKLMQTRNLKQEANAVVAWLQEYSKKAGNRAFVVGVSGGVDSGLVSTLCAMTGITTHCVILPCHSKLDGIESADRHIAWLDKTQFSKIVKHEIDLSSVFDQFKNECGYDYDNALGFANTKSRLRMTALYHVATCVSGLVVGTGNKVEDFGVKFFTKYGDGGVDISPIGEFFKSEVRQMARELGVAKEITEAIPVDGLWEDTRSDESQIGATYEELERAMKYIDEIGGIDRIGFMNTNLTDRQREVIVIYMKWYNAGQHKLNPIPVFKRS